MSGMQQGLTIIVAVQEPARFHAALSLATANAALDRPTRIFLQADAVAPLRPPVTAPDDARYAAAGLPSLGTMLTEALGLGVQITACQSGLALACMAATDLPPGVEVSGLVDMLRSDSQLLLV
ncbi:MAG TPA: DsrE family protein [Allosphingosinicella sp.]